MKLYDWVIAILIGALLVGAYFVFSLVEPTSPFYDDPVLRTAFIREFMTLVGLAILAFGGYFLVFRGPAKPLRTTAASALLLFLVALGLQLFPRYLLFTGWADDSDVANRIELLSVADWFSSSITLLSAIAFLGVGLLGVLRRFWTRG